MKRASNVNRTGAFEAVRKRMLRICALLLVCPPVPSGLAGQTEADRESVNRVVAPLLAAAGLVGDEIPHRPGTWSLVIARFAKGDLREVPIPAVAGEEYVAKGVAESFGTDIDICVYGPAGDQVGCDTLALYSGGYRPRLLPAMAHLLGWHQWKGVRHGGATPL